jgi:hypothetical protein
MAAAAAGAGIRRIVRPRSNSEIDLDIRRGEEVLASSTSYSLAYVEETGAPKERTHVDCTIVIIATENAHSLESGAAAGAGVGGATAALELGYNYSLHSKSILIRFMVTNIYKIQAYGLKSLESDLESLLKGITAGSIPPYYPTRIKYGAYCFLDFVLEVDAESHIANMSIGAAFGLKEMPKLSMNAAGSLETFKLKLHAKLESAGLSKDFEDLAPHGTGLDVSWTYDDIKLYINGLMSHVRTYSNLEAFEEISVICRSYNHYLRAEGFLDVTEVHHHIEQIDKFLQQIIKSLNMTDDEDFKVLIEIHEYLQTHLGSLKLEASSKKDAEISKTLEYWNESLNTLKDSIRKHLNALITKQFTMKQAVSRSRFYNFYMLQGGEEEKVFLRRLLKTDRLGRSYHRVETCASDREAFFEFMGNSEGEIMADQDLYIKLYYADGASDKKLFLSGTNWGEDHDVISPTETRPSKAKFRLLPVGVHEEGESRVVTVNPTGVVKTNEPVVISYAGRSAVHGDSLFGTTTFYVNIKAKNNKLILTKDINKAAIFYVKPLIPISSKEALLADRTLTVHKSSGVCSLVFNDILGGTAGGAGAGAGAAVPLAAAAHE